MDGQMALWVNLREFHIRNCEWFSSQVLVILFFNKLCYKSEHREDQNFAMLYSNVLILHEITRIITT